MKTKNVKVVLHADGENKGTYGVLGTFRNLKGKIDLDEKVDRFVSWDCNIPVEVDKYKLMEMTLPKWMQFGEWKSDRVTWKWLWGFGVPKEWSRERHYKLRRLRDQPLILAMVKLVKSNPRKPERKTLKKEVIEWLDNGKKDSYNGDRFKLVNKYIKAEADQLDRMLYRGRGF